MKKYLIDNVEYTLEEIQSAASNNGVDIDTYINDMGVQVIEPDEESVGKEPAAAETTAPAVAQPVDTDLQLEDGSSELVSVQ